ncbi:MAG: hypothetical protein K0V04_05975, partial [Deltaproteobacteria bacterium]|nr:hypothetical protein [Deltaproteobacteria bacterium]
MPAGFDFCPVCGQDQRLRLRRPDTAQLAIATATPGRAPGPTAPPVLTSVPPSGSDGATAAGMTVPAPGSGPVSTPSFVPPQAPPLPRPPPMSYAPAGSIDRTVPAPSVRSPTPPPAAPRQTILAEPGPPQPPTGQGSLIAAVIGTDTMEPPAGMPSVEATVGDNDRTVPHQSLRQPVGDDDRTVPHQMQHPVAISPVRAQISPATRPDRPGGFSGGPGHGPLPSVIRVGGTVAPIVGSSAQQGSTGR